MTEKTKYADHVRESAIAQAQNKPAQKAKDGKSTFDKLLEEGLFKHNLNPQNVLQDKSAATHEAIKQTQSQDQRGKDRERERDEKHSSEGGDKGTGDKNVSHARVQSKGSLKGQQGQDGSGQQQGGRDFFGGGNRRSLENMKRLTSDKRSAVVKGAADDKFAQELKMGLKEAVSSRPRNIEQEVINQVVQYVKVGKNEKGEKEMELKLKEKAFKGLRLKVASSGDGKVKVHFISSNADTKAIFEANRDRLMGALDREGIEVEEMIIS